MFASKARLLTRTLPRLNYAGPQASKTKLGNLSARSVTQSLDLFSTTGDGIGKEGFQVRENSSVAATSTYKMPGAEGKVAAEQFFDEKLASMYTDGNVAMIGIEDAYKKMTDGKAVLVDTRDEAGATDTSMIKGAITVDKLWEMKEKGELADKQVITQCHIGGGSCGFVTANKDKLAGLDVASAKLGLIGATHAGIPLVDKDGNETKKVVTVGPLKGMYAEGFEETVV